MQLQFTVLDDGRNKGEAFRIKRYTAIKDIPILTVKLVKEELVKKKKKR